jgi:DNA-directed RNA polymerase specialized sigma24 family protein
MANLAFPVAVEIPTVFEPWSRTQVFTRSDSELGALMEAMPYCDPEATVPQRQLLREAMADCVEQLDDEDRFLVEAIWFERLTVRALAIRLGIEKSQTHRLCTRAVVRLGTLCVEHPVFQAQYGVQVGLQSSA